MLELEKGDTPKIVNMLGVGDGSGAAVARFDATKDANRGP